jgi:hypothetical protein
MFICTHNARVDTVEQLNCLSIEADSESWLVGLLAYSIGVHILKKWQGFSCLFNCNGGLELQGAEKGGCAARDCEKRLIYACISLGERVANL